MILIQASKSATHQLDDQLMVVVFQQYLKSLRLTRLECTEWRGVNARICFIPNLHMMNGIPPMLSSQKISTIAKTYKY